MLTLGMRLGRFLPAKNQSSPAWSPAALSPALWYDMEDADFITHDLAANSFLNYIPVNAVTNKANPGTYDATQSSGTLKLGIDAQALNNNISLFNRGNGYMATTYFPQAGAFTAATIIKMPSPLGTRSAWGVNGSTTNRRFYLTCTSTGAVTFGIGSATHTTATTYAAGAVLYIVAIGTGTSLNMWINGVQVLTNAAYTFAGPSSNAIKLHCRTTGGDTATEQFNGGYLGDLIILERAITEAERLALETYMANKSSSKTKYHVILAAGQSNMAGFNNDADYTDAAKEKLDFRITQINRVGAYENMVIPAYEPLRHVSANALGVGLAYAAAKAYLATVEDPDVRVLIVPAAQFETGLADGAWAAPSGARLLDTVTRANLALAKGTQINSLLWLMWQQGEDDIGFMTQSAYAAAFDAMMAHYRANITGASQLPVTVGQMVPDKDGGVIALALADTPNRDAYAAYVQSTGLVDDGDDQHFDAPSARTMGQRHYAAYAAL